MSDTKPSKTLTQLAIDANIGAIHFLLSTLDQLLSPPSSAEKTLNIQIQLYKIRLFSERLKELIIDCIHQSIIVFLQRYPTQDILDIIFTERQPNDINQDITEDNANQLLANKPYISIWEYACVSSAAPKNTNLIQIERWVNSMTIATADVR